MKKLFKFFLLLLSILLILLFIFRAKVYRLNFALKMFSGVEQVERFRTVETYFPTRIISPSKTPSIFPRKPISLNLPTTFTYDEKQQSTKDFLAETDATGLLIIKNDSILFEKYYQGNTENSHTIAWSVTKSFVSALMGIAIQEGAVESIYDPAIKYVPELKNSAYENITIKNLLQMSSGVSWNEDYSDFNSDINRFGRTLALGNSFETFVKTLGKDKEQGTYNRYNSCDTQVLGMIISRATNTNLSEYLQEKIWHSIGMENKAWWVIDDVGDEFAAAGLNASLRDYARFGKLYLHKGMYNGQQIVPKQWVEDSLFPDAPHLQPNSKDNSDSSFGYGYQWWIPSSTENEFLAIGIYNQFIYVNPTHNIIIAKSSANNSYGSTDSEENYREAETIEFFRAIVKSLADKY